MLSSPKEKLAAVIHQIEQKIEPCFDTSNVDEARNCVYEKLELLKNVILTKAAEEIEREIFG